jgi:hypothetical protein
VQPVADEDDPKSKLEQLRREREQLQSRQDRVRQQLEALPGSGPADQRPRNWNPRRRHPYEMPLLEDPDAADRPRPRISHQGPFEFYFTRAAYSGYGLWGRYASWSVDYPKADVQFMLGIKRLIGHLDAYPLENPILLTDPALAGFPFLYAVEVGHMSLTEEEVLGLRRYLMSGGFMVIDDFWGTLEWDNLEKEFARILPGYRIVDLEPNHPVFHCFYDVDEIVQVPNVGKGREGGPTWEKDGYVARVRGISDDSNRLMVVINWNSDLGNAWEWAEDPHYPLRFSTYAYQMGVNYIIYAMSH